jgi:exodeoxyribonuclease V alpha subunit
VEPGYVLGDLCGTDRLPAFSAAFRAELEAACGFGLGDVGAGADAPLGDSVVPLIRSYRFGADGGIGALAGAINRADTARALAVLDDPARPEVSRAAPRPDELPRLLDEQVVPAYQACLEEGDPGRALAAFARVRVLAAVREGPYGVVRLNRLIEEGLRRRGGIRGSDPWYRGRPVMVTRNDYALNLFNGDLGVTLPGEDGRPRVWFPAPDGRVRGLLPARLPAHETVFAMTVHKSQGSEFDQVVAVLPEGGLEVATRELVYTAVTRARQGVVIWASPERLAEALARRVSRSSALRERLWGGAREPELAAPQQE